MSPLARLTELDSSGGSGVTTDVVRSPIIRRRPTYPDLENGLEEQLLLVDIGNVTLCMPSVDHCGSSILFAILDPPVLIYYIVISGYLLWLINFIFPELLYKNSYS